MSNLENFTKMIRNAYNNQLIQVVHSLHDEDVDNQALADLVVSPTSKFEKLSINDSLKASEYSSAFEIMGSKKAYQMLNLEYKNTKKNKMVQKYVSNHSFKMCKSLVDDVREEAKKIIYEGVQEGYHPFKMAKKIRDIPNNPLNEQPNPKFRSEMIAQTESAMSLNKGMDETMKSYGVEQANWITAGDMKVCSQCAAMEKGNPYYIEDLPLVMHPRCRCTRTYVIPKGDLIYNSDINTLSFNSELN